MKTIHEQDAIVGSHDGFADHSQIQSTWVRSLPEALHLAEAGLGLPINKTL
jgi:hypothetical protein